MSKGSCASRGGLGELQEAGFPVIPHRGRRTVATRVETLSHRASYAPRQGGHCGKAGLTSAPRPPPIARDRRSILREEEKKTGPLTRVHHPEQGRRAGWKRAPACPPLAGGGPIRDLGAEGAVLGRTSGSKLPGWLCAREVLLAPGHPLLVLFPESAGSSLTSRLQVAGLQLCIRGLLASPRRTCRPCRKRSLQSTGCRRRPKPCATSARRPSFKGRGRGGSTATAAAPVCAFSIGPRGSRRSRRAAGRRRRTSKRPWAGCGRASRL